MRIAGWILGIVVASVAIVAVAGFLLPVQHEASRSADFSVPPAEVYQVVSDFRHYPDWWPYIEKIEVIVDSPGRTTYRQFAKDGLLIMTQGLAVEPEKYMTRIDDPGQPFGGSWSFDIVEIGEGRSRLTITQRGEIYNPIYRALARYVYGYHGMIDSCIAALKEKLR